MTAEDKRVPAPRARRGRTRLPSQEALLPSPQRASRSVRRPDGRSKWIASGCSDGASGRNERPTVVQDPAKGLAAVVGIFNDKHVHTIEAAEVCVRESHSGTSLWLQSPATGVPGGGAWLGTEEKVLMLVARRFSAWLVGPSESRRPSRSSQLRLTSVCSAAQMWKHLTWNCISSLLMPPPAASSGSDQGPIAARDPETRLNSS
jgi:hypothetical protein